MPISEIEIGDTVIAYDEETGETGEYTVTDTISHEDESIAYVTISGEEIETTPWHLFYTGDGWAEAEDLQEGDSVVSLGGVYGTVDSVIIVDTVQTMYDLTVEEVHTFAVGEGDWVVHNCVKAGDGGRYRDLTDAGVVGDELEAHHIPSRSSRFTSVDDGGAIVLPAEEHAQTASYRGRARTQNNNLSELSFTERLQLDMIDVRQVAQDFYGNRSHYDAGLLEVLDYYHDNFPSLLNTEDYSFLSGLLNP